MEQLVDLLERLALCLESDEDGPDTTEQTEGAEEDEGSVRRGLQEWWGNEANDKAVAR